jgi:hypothetical protein
MTLILLTTRAPYPLADELTLAGYEVFESLAISEVLHLTEYYDVAAIIITAEYDHPALNEIQQHHITVKLNQEATAKDVVWELLNLFGGCVSVQ